MEASVEDFGTGWYGVRIGLKADDIDELIVALRALKQEKTHFHLRSDFEGDGGVGDVEMYLQSDEEFSNLDLEAGCGKFEP